MISSEPSNDINYHLPSELKWYQIPNVCNPGMVLGSDVIILEYPHAISSGVLFGTFFRDTHLGPGTEFRVVPLFYQ